MGRAIQSRAVFLAALSVAWLASAALPESAQALTNVSFDQTWMRAGERFDLQYRGPDGVTYDFKVYVATADLVRIELRWEFVDGNVTYVPSTWALKSNRSWSDAPAFSDFMWINSADVQAGVTRIGHEQAVLTQQSLTELTFTTATTTYKYDGLTGLLKSARDHERGSIIQMIARVSGINVPSPKTRPEYVMKYETAEMNYETSETSVSASWMPNDRLRLACPHIVPSWSGEAGTWCIGDYYSYSGEMWGRPTRGWNWSALAYGNVTVVLRDAVQVIGLWYCESAGPKLDERQMATCPGNRIGTDVIPNAGTHTLTVSSTFYGCLDPRSTDERGAMRPFTCKIEMQVEVIGLQLACDPLRTSQECLVKEDV